MTARARQALRHHIPASGPDHAAPSPRPSPTSWKSPNETMTPYPMNTTVSTIAAVDICGFGTRRDAATQLHLRRELYSLVEQACAMTGVSWPSCHREDRGDGALFVLPAGTVVDHLLDPFAHHLTAVLRRYNRMAGPTTRMKLRLAVHAGHVHRDEHGVAGPDVIHLFRLLEAPAFKRFAADIVSDLAVIVSDRLYSDVTGNGGLTDAGAYTPLRITSKETRTRAWTWTPGRH
jgi:hypothetical protein